MSFSIITWPGSLCIDGQMGTFVFSRIHDMFHFFRDPLPPEHDLRINPQYWSQKLTAIDRNGQPKFSAAIFNKRVQDYLDRAEASAEVRKAVAEDVLSRVDDGEQFALMAVYEFNHNGFVFRDFPYDSCKEFDYNFIWCCYAVVWGIKQYDTQHQPLPPSREELVK